jgi:hypothetical protein
MTDLVTALRDFNKDRKFSRKGPLCVALVITQHARKGLPLNPDELLTEAGGQVLGLGRGAVQAVLNRHDITRVLLLSIGNLIIICVLTTVKLAGTIRSYEQR